MSGVKGSSITPPIHALVIGVGGTGNALLPLLAALPIHGITIVDGDTVEAVNLPRQLLFAPQDIGRAKVSAAIERLRPMSAIMWREEFRFADPANIDELVQGHTVVADCTDDLRVRQVIAKACRTADVPLVSGAVHGRQVQVHTQIATQRDHAFFSGRIAEEQEGCDMRAVPAEVTTVTAALMNLRIADLLRGGDGLAGIMDMLDVERGRWMRIMGPTAGEMMDSPITPSHHA